MKHKIKLHWYVAQAREKGLVSRSQKHCGGWLKLANACGGNCLTKAEGKLFLRELFPKKKEKSLSLPAVNLHPDTVRSQVSPHTDAFLVSYEWRKLRMQAIKKQGRRCQCCGATPDDGVKIHVDHIKPRRLFPHLALDLDNLQVLCDACNHGKGNWDMTDWRPPEQDRELTEEQREHLRAIMEEDDADTLS